MAAVFIILIFMSYITLGLPDSAYGTALPFIRAELGISLSVAGIFTIILTVFSALSAAIMPRISKRANVGVLLAACSFLTGGSILAVSFSDNYYLICALAIPLGISGGGVDVSINNYVSEHYRSSVMNWVHAAWGLGAMAGPLLVTLALNLDGSWRTGFRILAGIQLVFAAILLITCTIWNKPYAPKKLPPPVAEDGGGAAKRKYAAITLCILSFFVYCGAEVSIGNWLNSMLIDGRGYDTSTGGTCVSVYFGAIMAGRIITGLFSNKLGNRRCVAIGLIAAMTGCGLLFIKNVAATYVAVTMIGLGFAPVYPCLMHETKSRFDIETSKKVVGYQVSSACIGMLSLSPLTGVIMDNTSLEALPAAVAAMIGLLIIIVFTLDAITPNPQNKKASPESI